MDSHAAYVRKRDRVTAHWDGEEYWLYTADYPDGLHSSDGDSWVDGYEDARGDKFSAYSIRLWGGPRHGDIVA